MDLKVHQVILYYAMKNSVGIATTNSDFLNIWAGNWMTDINQASCVLTMLPKKLVKRLFKNNVEYQKYLKLKEDKLSVYNAFVSTESVEYNLNPLLKSIEKNWTNLINELWNVQVKSILDENKAIKNNTGDICPFDLQKIGMYYPLDHFDVVYREDIEEKDNIRNKFTKTAHDGLYEHALKRLLKTTFELRDKEDKTSLFYLGRALHVLSDFYAHSNFVYLIIRYFAEKNDKYNSIDNYFNNSWENILFNKSGSIDKIPVMTGRFDTIDSLASILKIYKNFLIPDFNDFNEQKINIGNSKPQEGLLSKVLSDVEQDETILVLNILFGTFSNIEFFHGVEGITIFSARVLKFLKYFKAEIKNIFLDFVDVIVEDDLKTTENEHLADFVKELHTFDADDKYSKLQNYLKAAKISYFEHIIQKTLYKNLSEHETEYLPHHTLIANDNDNIIPVKRLEYKMACCFAHSVTKEIIELYYKNGSLDEAQKVIERYYIDPIKFYEVNEEKIIRDIEEMYGCRWWEYIKNE